MTGILRLGACGLFILTLLTPPARGQAFAIGAVQSSTPGLSFLYVKSPTRAVHLTGHFSKAQAIAVEAVLERLYQPFPAEVPALRLYSGAGLRGEAQKDPAPAEAYHLVLPVGFVVKPADLAFEVFAEVRALVGALPNTDLAGKPSFGLRAYF